ncbi:MAG: terminase family protein [Cyanobacteria bacterium P01_D01_bin.56]
MSLSLIAKVERLKGVKAKRKKARQSAQSAEASQTPTEKLWAPRIENKPQREAYEHPADRLLYGGAAGGGKSDLLLGLAFTAHKKSIIFRREFPQLAALEDRAKEIAKGNGRYNSIAKRWSNLPNGRIVEFGAVQHEDSKNKYQGRPHDFIGFDELTHFTRSQFEFLTGWNRSASGHRCRIVASSNPPTTPEGEWVKTYWGPWLDSDHELYPYPPGELLWFITIGESDRIVDGPEPVAIDGAEVIPHSRSFIPAKLADNPDLQGTNYRAVLMAMPEPLRSQMLYGSFDATPIDDPWQVIPTAWVEGAQARWKESPRPNAPQTALGVDVARGGTDQTILAPRYGWWYDELTAYPGVATPDGASVAAQVQQHLGSESAAFIDVVGVGASVYDHCSGLTAYPVSAGTKAENNHKERYTDKSGQLEFVNLRSWMIWRFRELLDPDSGENIALPPDNKLKADLCAPRWKMASPIAGSKAQGRIAVESKDEVKKRIGRSPDRGDAVQYAAIPKEHFNASNANFSQSEVVWRGNEYNTLEDLMDN